MNFPKVLLSLCFLLFALAGWAQRAPAPAQPRPAAQPQADKVELVNAGVLEGGMFNGVEIRKLIGNVVLKQKDMFLYCDSAYQYGNRNLIEAFSNVRITQGDTLTITGDAASYDGDKRTARIRGNVFMQDPRMTLTTPSLDYDLNKKEAYYTEGGHIVEGANTLDSRMGTYNTNTKMFVFKQKVNLVTPDNTILSDNLQYNTETKIAYFQGPTTIKGAQGDLYAEGGEHNTITKISTFRKNAAVETPSYRLTGDFIYYDENRQYGNAKTNVRMISKKDNVVITGENAEYWRAESRAIVTGSPLMQNIMSDDTLYLAADRFISQEANAQHEKGTIHAMSNVKIFKKDLQGLCDTLIYNLTDSVVYMNHEPILWSDQNQLTAGRIEMHMANDKISRMYMYSSAYMVSQDTLRNFNQIKGRDMVAQFTDNKIRRLTVNGNSESIYFALANGDSTVMGMDRKVCSDMIFKFGEDNKLQYVTFLTNVDSQFIPPHELKEEEKQLKGFAWRLADKPILADLLMKREPAKVAPKPVPAKKPAPKPKKKDSKVKTKPVARAN